MAINTYKVFLMQNTQDTTWEKVIDIKDFPDLGGAPETIDTTTLSDRMKTSIPGIQSVDALEFTANYTSGDYKKLQDLEGKDKKYAVWFGGTETTDSVTPTGIEGKFQFNGSLSVYLTGGGVNEVVGMKITIAPSSPITKVES